MSACPHCGGALPDVDVQRIVRLVAADFDVDADELVGLRRFEGVAWARQVAMYLAYELLELSYPAVGRAFGRDHTTVLYAHRRVQAESRTNAALRIRLRRLAAVVAPC